MTKITEIRVLLIDDDEDDYVLTREMLAEAVFSRFHLDWVDNVSEARQCLAQASYDVYLLDYRLGAYDGMSLLEEAIAAGCGKPIIMLTGYQKPDVDRLAMEKGAADYLVKGEFQAQALERSIQYAIRHRQTLNDLALSKARYQAVVDSQTEMICRYEPDTTLTFVNGAYCRYHGKSHAELIGTRWLALVPEEQHADILRHIDALIKGRCSVVYEGEIHAPSGETRWQQWTDTVVSTLNADAIEIQSVGTDITERKQAEIALREALERERELGELKSRFVSMASHEFRTPLTTIMSTASYLEVAEGSVSSEKRLARLRKIQAACMDMTALLDDVLFFGRAEANRLEFKPARLDLVAFCAEVVEDLQTGMAHDHEIRLSASEPSLPVMVDEKLLRQIITNLLSNAVKYSPKSSRIELDATRAEGQLRLTIRDYGRGIASDDMARLFDPFYRGRNVEGISGTGLGLAIVRTAVEIHGGTIECDSTLGQGATFYINLPDNIEG